MNNKKYKKMERIIIDKENIDAMEEDIIIRRGIERYMYVRQFVYGNVLDAACGVGYGSYLLSKNPDVKHIISVDRNQEAILNGNENFKNEKIEFIQNELSEIEGEFDVLVSLETIEHLPNPMILKEIADRCKVKELIISFPTKTTTHYNKYHLWDFTKDDIIKMFNNFECYKTQQISDSMIMNFVKIDRARVEKKHFEINKIIGN